MEYDDRKGYITGITVEAGLELVKDYIAQLQVTIDQLTNVQHKLTNITQDIAATNSMADTVFSILQTHWEEQTGIKAAPESAAKVAKVKDAIERTAEELAAEEVAYGTGTGDDGRVGI